MYSLDTTLANGSFPSKIQAMRDQLEFLKSLEDSPLYGPGVHQMDGDPPEIPSRTVTMHEPVADAAAADAVQGQASGSHSVKSSHGAGRGLPCKRSACADAGAVPGLPLAQVLGRDMGTADDPPPPMPPSFGNIRQRLPNILGQKRTDPLDYWNFCYRALRQSKRVMGCKEFVAAYSAWQVSEGQRPTFGHSRWWDMDRDLLLRLCTRAGVKITDGHHAKILQAFWKQHRKRRLNRGPRRPRFSRRRSRRGPRFSGRSSRRWAVMEQPAPSYGAGGNIRGGRRRRSRRWAVRSGWHGGRPRRPRGGAVVA
jgi:hypothetical protein